MGKIDLSEERDRYECDNEQAGSIKCGEFLYKLKKILAFEERLCSKELGIIIIIIIIIINWNILEELLSTTVLLCGISGSETGARGSFSPFPAVYPCQYNATNASYSYFMRLPPMLQS